MAKRKKSQDKISEKKESLDIKGLWNPSALPVNSSDSSDDAKSGPVTSGNDSEVETEKVEKEIEGFAEKNQREDIIPGQLVKMTHTTWVTPDKGFVSRDLAREILKRYTGQKSLEEKTAEQIAADKAGKPRPAASPAFVALTHDPDRLEELKQHCATSVADFCAIFLGNSHIIKPFGSFHLELLRDLFHLSASKKFDNYALLLNNKTSTSDNIHYVKYSEDSPESPYGSNTYDENEHIYALPANEEIDNSVKNTIEKAETKVEANPDLSTGGGVPPSVATASSLMPENFSEQKSTSEQDVKPYSEIFDLTPPFPDNIKKYDRFDRLAIAAPRGHAKALSMNSKVLTLSGWIFLKDLRVGDFVFGGNGKLTKVIALHPVSKMKLWRVKTRDGRSVLCNDDHLWNVQTPSNTGSRIITKPLKDLRKNYVTERFDKRVNKVQVEYRHFIPSIQPIEFPERKLDIDPYTLGVWLGDGHSASARITSADPEIFKYIPYQSKKTSGKYLYQVSELHTKLRGLNLLNNKHIPADYLMGSVAQREALLQGLIDTDGHIQPDGKRGDFTTILSAMKDGFVALVRSLGGTATIGDNWTTCNGKRFFSYRITFRLPASIIPCRLSRKRSVWKGSLKTRSAIVSITEEPDDLARCITVENPDGTFVTDDYLLTHNSTLVSLGYVLWAICYQVHHFILLISDSEDQAKMLINTVREELDRNDLLRACFGNLAGDRIWGEMALETNNGIRVQIRGTGQRIRGLKFRNYRPDLVICDDIESDQLVETEEQRRKLKRWFYSALLPALDMDGKLVFIGTVLHEDALLPELLTTWPSRTYAADKNKNPDCSEPLWPEAHRTKDLLQIKEDYASRGMVDLFYREYFNQIVSPDEALFKPENFKYIDLQKLEDRVNRGEKLKCFLTVDPAYTVSGRSDYTVFSICYTDSSNNMYFGDFLRGRWQMPQTISIWFGLLEKYTFDGIGIQSIDWAKSLKIPVETEMRRRQKFFRVTELQVYSATNKGLSSKKSRISRLAPRYQVGMIHHIKEAKGIKEYEGELKSFPHSKHEDMADAASMMLDLIFPAQKKKEVKPFRFEHDVDPISGY